MKKPLRLPCAVGLSRPTCQLALMLALSAANGFGQSITQTFQIEDGWNSIWLQVDPQDPSPASVFAGAPIESVWTHGQRLTAVDFIQDADEPVWNRDQWLMFVPTNRVESFQNNLFRMGAKRPYLIRASEAFTLTVTGRPPLRPLVWVSDGYNLRGLPVSEAGAPSFLDFFRHSAAHVVGNQMEPIYRLTDLPPFRKGVARCWPPP